MKKVLYSALIVCLTVAGFSSCNPQESDSHSFTGTAIAQEAVSWDVTQSDNTFTFRNTSQPLDGVRYYLSADGKKLKEFPIGDTYVLPIKSNGTYSVKMYAFSGNDQKELVWTKDVDWIISSSDKQWLGFSAGKNLLADTNPSIGFWFADGSWSQVADPAWEGSLAEGITFVKSETGDSQWMAQMYLQDFGINLSAGKTYDFSIAIISSADVPGAGVTIKPQKQGDDETAFSDARHQIKAGVNVITLTNCAGFDGGFRLSMDYAGTPVGTIIIIKNIYLAEHNAANVAPEGGDSWAFDFSSDDNLLKSADFTESFWFADNNWSQIADPEHEGDMGEYEFTIPEGTGASQWQAQVPFLFEKVNLSSGKRYDFSFVVIADHDIPGMTVKPQKLGDDETYFSADRYDVKANVPTAITLPDNAGFDGALRISLDFGGTPAGTKVHLYGITLQEHK